MNTANTVKDTSPRSSIYPLGLLFTLALGALSGVLISLAMPHGPATAPQALLVLGASLAVGVACGRVMRSRWVALLAPLAHILAIEIARLGVGGPTAGAIRLDEPYGIIALVLGRGFHGLVGLLPMLIGIGFGRALAKRAAGDTRAIRPVPTIVGAVVVLGLAVALLLPASTPPFKGADGQPVPGSIAELASVPVDGADLGLLIRGRSADNPVLLYLSGGPGQTDLPFSRVVFEDMAQDFIVASLDQRGTGKSYVSLDPTSALTLDRAVADVIAVTDYLRRRFDEQKIYLLGESWGSTLGILAIQRRPDLYYAWIGSGQMVSQRETDRRLYADVLALAAHKGDSALEAKMRAYGEPPYRDQPFANAFVMGYYDALSQPYTRPESYEHLGEGVVIGPWGVLAEEYNLVEKVNVLRGLMDMFTVMYPQLQDIDFRRDVTHLDVPVYILDGKAELSARRDLLLEWFDRLEAPRKQMFSFDNAGHAVAMEQFVAFHQIMNETIVPETYTAR